MSDQKMTNDQVAIAVNLGIIEGLATSSADDAMVLNRLVSRGPDPLSIITVMPSIAEQLAVLFYLESWRIRGAVELAHKVGPGALLQGKPGLNPEMLARQPIASWSMDERLEAAWVVLAAYSPCVEAGYGEEISFAERLGAMVKACASLATMIHGANLYTQFAAEVQACLGRILNPIDIEVLNEQGHVKATSRIPGMEDRGFYAAYKAGHNVCCVVDARGNTFWGTDGSVTLGDEGVEVDKFISDYFGIVFPKS